MKPKFKVGQVVYVGYAREYRRVVRINKYGICVGTTRQNIPIQFKDARHLTAKERGQK